MNLLGRNMEGLQASSFIVSSTAITPLLRSCRTCRDLHQAHTHIIRRGCEQDHFIIANFLSMCVAVLPANLSYPTEVFNSVSFPNIYLWNIMMKAHCENSSLDQCFSFFSRMRRWFHVVPDKYTFPSFIKACANVVASREGRVVHGAAFRSGVEGDVFVGSSLIDFYGKCGEIECARKIFDGMPLKNEVSWTAMMVGYSNFGDMAAAKCLFDEMPKRNQATWNAMIKGFVKLGDLKNAKREFDVMPVRDEVSFTTLLDGYAKAGDMVAARSFFDELPRKDLISWSALISGYVKNGKTCEAMKAFGEMSNGNVKPDEFVMVSLMSACSQLGSSGLADWIESYIGNGAFDLKRAHVVAALIDMNAKCGNMERATLLFEEMTKRDLVSYCSMMQGLYLHGRGAEAVSLFYRMIDEGIRPDNVAFTVVLTACSHACLVDDAVRLFDLMIHIYSISPSPDHYACMVNILAKSGKLNTAYELIQSTSVDSHAGAWGALHEACRLHCDIELSEVVAGRLFELEPQSAGNYVLQSNINAEADRWSNVVRLRDRMTERGLRKVPGCSYVESDTPA